MNFLLIRAREWLQHSNSIRGSHLGNFHSDLGTCSHIKFHFKRHEDAKFEPQYPILGCFIKVRHQFMRLIFASYHSYRKKNLIAI